MFQARGQEGFVTTVGQLNFFRWFIEKEILEYVTGEREAIEKDMNSTLKTHYSHSNSSRASTGTPVTSEATTETLSSGGKTPSAFPKLTKIN